VTLPPNRDARLLGLACALLASFMLAEVIVALFASSLVLLADAGHLLTDTLALVMAIVALRLAQRPPRDRWTFGLARAEVLSAAVNAVTLLVVSAVVLVEAIRRLVHPTEVSGWSLVVVAAIGLVVNLVATLILARADRRSLNIAGAFAHVMTDAAAFAATLVAGVIVLVTGWHRVDPVAALLVVALMVRAAVSLLRESGKVLLEAAPEQVDIEQLRSHLLSTDDVVAVHDLHVWTSGSRLPTASAHVVVSDAAFADGRAPRILDQLQACCAGHFDVEHSTFQLEPLGHASHEAGAH
jgi:cobalt-zinc-cadmium efflux system protein